MRYYIINSDGKEVSFDLSFLKKEFSGSKKFKVTSKEDAVDKTYYVRSLADKLYVSQDEKIWSKLPRVKSKDGLVNVNENINVYRGFKPSGLGNAKAGNLVTEMPGKIVKVMTTEGAMVNEGSTLLILEAMKMENEIKAGVSGVVKAVHVTEGQTIDSGHLMIEIEE